MPWTASSPIASAKSQADVLPAMLWATCSHLGLHVQHTYIWQTAGQTRISFISPAFYACWLRIFMECETARKPTCMQCGLECLQAAKTPHQDLSLAEVEAAVRSSEHLLFLQRQQRQALGQAQAAVASLQALGTRLQELSPDGLELKLQVGPCPRPPHPPAMFRHAAYRSALLPGYRLLSSLLVLPFP